MPSDSKPEKLFERVEKLVSVLRDHHDSLHIHRNIDDFYYMQKIAELKQLEESIVDTYERLELLQKKYDSEYVILFRNWKRDLRWINKFLNQQKQELETKE